MSIVHLSDIRLVVDELGGAFLSSSQRIYSPTAPSPPVATLGWRDRWWLNGQPSQSVSIHYWLFQEPEDAYRAADAGRGRFSTRRVVVNGEPQPIYQKLAASPCGEVCWQALHNILFVRDNVTILVAESGQTVQLGNMLSIASQIDLKLCQQR